jgi:hypothetical protein
MNCRAYDIRIRKIKAELLPVWVQPTTSNMKRIKIAAIGAMIFLGIACNKDKNQLEPTQTNSPSAPSQPYKAETGLTNGENITHNELGRQNYGDPVVSPNPPILTSDPGTSDPARIRSGNIVEPTPKYTERTVIGIRNDENVHPYQGTARTIKGVRNDEMINPYQGSARNIIGVRNDETINPYQNASKTSTTIVLPDKKVDNLDTSPDQNPY